VEELYRPLVHGYCRYESLIDGTLDLADIAELNDLIDLVSENQARLTP